MRNGYNWQAKGLRRNFILMKHISISLHVYRECLNRGCEIEIKSDEQIEDVPTEPLLYLKVNAKTLGNVLRLACFNK